MYRRTTPLGRFWLWLPLIIIFIGIVLYGFYIWLNWKIMQSMYLLKSGLDWFNITFYHNYTFILAAILALLTLNPMVGRSDLYEAWEAFQWMMRMEYGTGEAMPTFSPKTRRTLWIFWQLFKWVAAFLLIASINGLPFLGKVTPIFCMAMKGIGDWRLIPRIMLLPVSPASSSELISLMPTMEVEYRLVYILSTAILALIAIRFGFKLVKHFLRGQQNIWVRDIFLIMTCIMISMVLGSPYWAMDATTPFDYMICVILLVGFAVATVFFHFVGFQKGQSFSKRRRMVLLAFTLSLIILLAIDAAIIAGFRLNWNNNWIEYEWKPLTEKQIAVTRWAAGIEDIERMPLSALPSGNVTKTLSLVRQWDRWAAHTRMINRIGSNWMTLADSDIIYIHGREYWVAPTTILYPSKDWISTHLIYTHTSRIIVIDSHTGEYVDVKEAFKIRREPLIYYGEGEGFSNPVYVNVRGFNEVENISYSKEPDYTLTGWERVLWFLFQGQIGFAFSPPQESINMLYNRDVLKRVKDLLIYGLEVDPDAYLVSDGENVYYAVQVYIDYPMHSGFSASSYLRYFAVVLVNIEDGTITGYGVGKPDGFLIDFYKEYYNAWKPIDDPSADWLRPQLRYPEALLGMHDKPGQLDIDFKFHVNDPFAWRSGNEFYERPAETEVLYVLFVDQNDVYFAGIQIVEYMKSESKNLAAIYLAYGGEDLGRIVLYEVPASARFLGPTSALDSLRTNKEVKTKLTFYQYPQASRLGNILLYPIKGKLYYFIPLYLTGSIMATMPQIGIVDASSGSLVAMGSDAAEAYYNLIGAPVEVGASERLRRVREIFIQAGCTLINITAVHPDVEVREYNLTYIKEADWSSTKEGIESFIERHSLSGCKVLVWHEGDDIVNFGVLELEDGTWRYLYYISVKYR
ncbi:hypothetical protein DRO55_01645 [Candidatus Bathyarchaeota archaeon]|nr:MAG: hypothetical protein DRO55_01645 [Candidatus Bathyarchaeota archaeon]